MGNTPSIDVSNNTVTSPGQSAAGPTALQSSEDSEDSGRRSGNIDSVTSTGAVIVPATARAKHRRSTSGSNSINNNNIASGGSYVSATGSINNIPIPNGQLYSRNALASSLTSSSLSLSPLQLTPASSLSIPSTINTSLSSSSSDRSLASTSLKIQQQKLLGDSKPSNLIGEYINRLLALKIQSNNSNSYNNSKSFCMTPSEIKTVCHLAYIAFMSQPVFLELGTPVKVCGDIHGQFGDLKRIFQLCGLPPKSNYLFLGDYVDRGKFSLETIMLLLCLKIKYPENVFLLRGNHECANVTKVYGFYDECKRRCSVKVWKTIVDVFNALPIAATIGGKIFCVHGGLSPTLNSLNDIKNIQRPTDVPDTGLISDLLWSDPDGSVHSWSENERGISYCFGKPIVEKFCRKYKFDLIARGHMVVEDGYEFFHRRKLVTVFSAPNYCGDFGNWGAVMSVSRDLLCSFDLIKPLESTKKLKAQ